MATQSLTDVLADSVQSFLNILVEIHVAAVAIHNDYPRCDCNISQLSTTLATTVVRFRGDIKRHDDADSLARNCLKLGQDLSLRLDRVKEAQQFKSAENDLRAVWPAAAVDALGERIKTLQSSWSISRSQQSPIQELTRIRATGANEIIRENIENSDSTTGGIGNVQLKLKPAKIAKPGAPADLLEDFILDSLAYKSMHDREEEVAEAHGKTFEWIFEQETDRGINNQFKTWLATDELGPIYWISGKPGSGKSTLMRFLFGHSNTTASLKSWAGNIPFSKAGFFFWTSGSKEQRSQTGLLRSLLYQLLSENRTMIPESFPDLWQNLQTLTTKERIKLSLQWNIPELMRAFHSFVDAAVEFSKVCLFIDGLDEFDGNQKDLVQFFRSLGKESHAGRVKMCLSSRPWAVFETSFQSSVPNLKLQQLTNQDMYHFVADTLNSDVQIRTCFEGDATVKHALSKEIVQRAEGVFLWARLTVTKILKDFRPKNGISQFQIMIRSQPSQLDDLFEKLIFIDQNAAEISETANLFQLITARETAAGFVNDETANSLNVWEIGLALDPDGDELALSEEEVQQASDDEVKSRCEDTCARIDQRFMGLLGVFPQSKDRDKRATIAETEEEENHAASARGVAGNKVTYVHRTVRDWLMEGDGVREHLISKSHSTFDPHLRLLRAGVLVLKLPVKRPWRRRWLNDWWPQITICMTHARESQIDPDHLLRLLLNELDRTIGWYWIPRIGDPSDHWAKHMFHSYEVRMKAPPIHEPYLCLVTKFGIANYVQEELKDLDSRDSRKSLEPAPNNATLRGNYEEWEAGGEIVIDRVRTDKKEDDGEEEEEEGEEEEEEEDEREGTPLLSYAIDYLCSRENSIYPLSIPSFASSLLETPSRHNPGPNHIYTDFIPVGAQNTAWLALLGHLRCAHRRGWIAHLDIDPQSTSRWVEIVKLFLKTGADVNAIVPADRWYPEMNMFEILEVLEKEYCSTEVSELRKWVGTKWGECVELSLAELEMKA